MTEHDDSACGGSCRSDGGDSSEPPSPHPVEGGMDAAATAADAEERDGGRGESPPDAARADMGDPAADSATERLSRERDEALEQASALLEAASLLSRLAAMDPADACQRRRLGSRDGSVEGKGARASGRDAPSSSSTGKKRPRRRSSGEEGEGRGSVPPLTPVGDGEADDGTKSRACPTEVLAAGTAEVVCEDGRGGGVVLSNHATGSTGDERSGGRAGNRFFQNDANDNVGVAVDNDDEASAIQRRIDALQATWMLEDTPIPALLTSIQRLQSNLAAVQAESESATAEMHALHRSLSKSRYHEQKLERALKKLYKLNKALKERLDKKKRDRKSFVKNVKEAVSGMKMLKRKEEELELEERQVANRLRVHESMLRMGSMSSRSKVDAAGTVATTAAAVAATVADDRDGSASSSARARADSSELDPPLNEDDSTRKCYDRDDRDFESGSVGVGSALSSVPDDADVISVTSISESSVSTTSVDDSGVATVRLAPSSSFPPPSPGDGDDGKDIGDHILVRDAAGDDGLKWSSVRSTFGLGESSGSGGTSGSIRARASLFSSTSSDAQPAHPKGGKGEKEDTGEKGGGSDKVRDRAASADDVLSWSSVRATFGVGAVAKATGGGDAPHREKLPTPTSSMGQRLMAQLRSPGSQPVTAAASERPSHVYKLTFPSGKKIGLQFQKVPIDRGGGSSSGNLSDDKTRNEEGEESVNFNHGQEFDGVSNTSPFRTAAADVSADLRAIGVKIDTLLLRNASASHDSADATTGPFSVGTGGGAPGEAVADDDDVLPEFAFLVCGYRGFDDALNVRPTIGARLVAVDGESLERGRWTFRRVRAVIEARANSSSPGGTCCSTFTMSFRNEPLTAAQKAILDNAVAKADERRRSSTDPSCPDDEGGSGKPPSRAKSGADGGGANDGLPQPPPAPSLAPTLATGPGKGDNSGEDRGETSFLKKLSLKRRDSKDGLRVDGPSPRSSVDEALVASPGGHSTLGGNIIREEEADGKGEDSPPLPSTTLSDAAKVEEAVAAAPATTAASEKEESLSSAEDFKTTMKAMSKKFKSFF